MKLRLFEEFSRDENYGKVLSEIQNFTPGEIVALLRDMYDIVSGMGFDDAAHNLRFAADKIEES